MIKIKWQIPSIILLIAFVLTACSIIRENAQTDELSKEEKFRQEVITYAKKQKGATYRYAGRDPRGFDCSGFTHYVMDNFEISLSTSSRSQAKEGKEVPIKEVQAGDLVFFKRSKAGRVFHVSLVVSNDKNGLQVIHSTSRGVTIDNITTSKYWKPKISSAKDVISSTL